jgi:hypothetical protein
VKQARARHGSKRMQIGSRTHGGSPEFGDVCTTCGAHAPCATTRLADAVEALVSENEQLREQISEAIRAYKAGPSAFHEAFKTALEMYRVLGGVGPWTVVPEGDGNV